MFCELELLFVLLLFFSTAIFVSLLSVDELAVLFVSVLLSVFFESLLLVVLSLVSVVASVVVSLLVWLALFCGFWFPQPLNVTNIAATDKIIFIFSILFSLLD